MGRRHPKPRQEFMLWLDDVVRQFGSDTAVGKYCGFKDGANVGRWKQGYNNPSIEACVKLAKARGEDPIKILRMAGHTEVADLLSGYTAPADPMPVWVPQLKAVVSLLDTAVKMMDKDKGQGNGQHEPEADELPDSTRKNRVVRPAERATNKQNLEPGHASGDYPLVASPGGSGKQTGSRLLLS